MAYNPPGVSVTEYTNPVVSPLLATADTLCLVGPIPSAGITKTDLVTLTSTNAVRLPSIPTGGVLQSVSSVVLAPNAPSGNTSGTSYAAAQYVISNIASASSVLASDLTNGANELILSSVAGFPTSGTIQIENEIISYTNVDNTNKKLTGLTRGASGTTAVAHIIGTAVTTFTNTIARSSGSTITSGDSVYVTYTYTPANYYNLIQLDTMSDVQDRFGSVYNSDGSIYSTLSFAAQIAFENGANSLYLQPLFTLDSNGNRVQPANTGNATAWDKTFEALRAVENLNFIVPVIGQGNDFPVTAGIAVASIDTTAESITTSVPHGLVIGQALSVTGTVGSLSANTTYYVKTVSSPYTITLSTTQNGSVLDLTSTTVTNGYLVPSRSPATTAQVDAIHSKLKDHLVTMVLNSGEYIIGFVGHDGTPSGDTALSASTLGTKADNLRSNHSGQNYDQQIVFVSPTSLQRPVSTNTANKAIQIGGQYAAVAVAAMAASREVSVSLTRKNIGGFSAILNPYTKKEKNSLAEKGILVIEQADNTIQVRHAITTDIANGVGQSELSVVRAKHFMMTTLKDTVDTQIIGKVYADGNAPLVVSTVISTALETLKNNGDIVDFSDVQARTLPTGPTTVDVRFNYRPAFPVNYINIGFSIDLTSGTSSLPDANILQVG